MAASFQVACPQWGRGYSATAGSLRRGFQCKKCGTSFRLSGKASGMTPAGSSTDAAAGGTAPPSARSTAGGGSRATAKSAAGGGAAQASAPSAGGGSPTIGPYQIRRVLGQG